MKPIHEALASSHILLDLESQDMGACLDELTRRLVARNRLSEEQGRRLDEALKAREKLGATCIGHGVCLPHAYVAGMDEPMVFFARLRQSFDYGAQDGMPVDLIFLLTGPQQAEVDHLHLLARLVRLLHDRRLLAELRSARTPEEVREAIEETERRHA